MWLHKTLNDFDGHVCLWESPISIQPRNDDDLSSLATVSVGNLSSKRVLLWLWVIQGNGFGEPQFTPFLPSPSSADTCGHVSHVKLAVVTSRHDANRSDTWQWGPLQKKCYSSLLFYEVIPQLAQLIWVKVSYVHMYIYVCSLLWCLVSMG